MLIVISSATPVANEIVLINQLFDEGLSLFHLRKPHFTEQELKLFLKAIHPVHYTKIALHNYHPIAKDYGINRFHFNEESRKKIPGAELAALKASGAILSTSIHAMTEYDRLSRCFDYTFIGPVYDSISKQGYKAMPEKDRLLNAGKRPVKLIALGGIHEDNCTALFESGFDGIALLGAIWKDQDGINTFKKVQAKCPATVQ